VREHFRRFRFRQAVIHRAVQMKRDLRDLARSNERADRYQAAVSYIGESR
jgi:hypothetical protein